MDDVDIKEKDVDMNEIRRICSENTIEELEAEFEKFKKEFVEKHKNVKQDLKHAFFYARKENL